MCRRTVAQITAIAVAGGTVVLLWPAVFACDGPKVIPPAAPELFFSPLRLALYEAAFVYGRAGCGDFALAEATARQAVRNGVPAGLLAALVAVESRCDPLAVSHRGAIGLTQVRPTTWKAQFDFQRVNPLNSEDSLRIGAEILGSLITKHGLREGVRHYNGQGEEARRYADAVLRLAFRKD